MNKKSILILMFLAMTVSFIPCEEVLYNVIEDAPAWVGNFSRQDNIVTTIRKGEIVQGIDAFESEIDDKDCFLSEIIYNNRTYKVQSDKLVPAVTDDLFDDSWLTDFSNESGLYWKPDYYLTVLLSKKRDTFYEFEYRMINWYNEIKERTIGGVYEWYEHFRMDLYDCLVMDQVAVHRIAGGYSFIINNIKTINNGYKINVVNPEFGKHDNYISRLAISFPTDRPSFDLLLIRDNDYLDMYLDTPENRLATFVRLNKAVMEELKSLLNNNTCDLTNVSLPHRSPKQLNVGEECRVLENLRLRESPGTTGAVIMTMKQGSKVTIQEIGQDEVIDGVSSPWVKVQTASGEAGWCFGLYLRETRFEPTPEELAAMLERREAEETENSEEETGYSSGAVTAEPKSSGTKLFLSLIIGIAFGGAVVIMILLKERWRCGVSDTASR